MKKKALPIVFILVVMFSVGCATATYTVGGKKFHSSSEALDEQAKINSNNLAKITPTNAPVHGTLLVLLPSDVEIQKNYITSRGDTSKISEEMHNFMITFTKNSHQSAVDMIRKKDAFDSVSVAYKNGNPASFPIGEYDYLLFLDVDGWFLRGKDNPKALPVGTLVGHQKVLQLDVLETQAKVLGGK